MGKLIADIDFDPSKEEVNISKRSIVKHKLDYRYNSLCIQDKPKEYKVDTPKLLSVIDPHAAQLFWVLINKRNVRTNIAKHVGTNRTEANKVSKLYKILKDNNLVVRVKRGEYLINPMAYAPQISDYKDVRAYWLSIKEPTPSGVQDFGNVTIKK